MIKQKIMVSVLEYNDSDSCQVDVLGCKEYEIENNKIPKKLVESMVTDLGFSTRRIFGKLNTVMEYKLSNGFSGIESTTCVDEKNYSFEIGKKILTERLNAKIWYGLGFALGLGLEDTSKENINDK